MHIVRQVGTPKNLIDLNGNPVNRVDKIFVPEMNYWVPVAMYDNQTIYDSGSKKKGQSPYLCSCGSIAVIIGSNVYKKDQSPSGALFVCLSHAQTGRHSDGSS